MILQFELKWLKDIQSNTRHPYIACFFTLAQRWRSSSLCVILSILSGAEDTKCSGVGTTGASALQEWHFVWLWTRPRSSATINPFLEHWEHRKPRPSKHGELENWVSVCWERQSEPCVAPRGPEITSAWELALCPNQSARGSSYEAEQWVRAQMGIAKRQTNENQILRMSMCTLNTMI